MVYWNEEQNRQGISKGPRKIRLLFKSYAKFSQDKKYGDFRIINKDFHTISYR